jgi:alkanesulfonate monooxygenase SsuD/methylene tetrahydromethanopterin reductase-like flavin-dependent oxidoreductase (luciferase family)
LAALHPALTFGASVVCQSYRNPALLAKMAANLQLLTGGRFVLGLGAGWILSIEAAARSRISV